MTAPDLASERALWEAAVLQNEIVVRARAYGRNNDMPNDRAMATGTKGLGVSEWTYRAVTRGEDQMSLALALHLSLVMNSTLVVSGLKFEREQNRSALFQHQVNQAKDQMRKRGTRLVLGQSPPAPGRLPRDG